jgi:predicted component of type VI protein secretion system
MLSSRFPLNIKVEVIAQRFLKNILLFSLSGVLRYGLADISSDFAATQVSSLTLKATLRNASERPVQWALWAA